MSNENDWSSQYNVFEDNKTNTYMKIIVYDTVVWSRELTVDNVKDRRSYNKMSHLFLKHIYNILLHERKFRNKVQVFIFEMDSPGQFL